VAGPASSTAENRAHENRTAAICRKMYPPPIVLLALTTADATREAPVFKPDAA
jgi:hypothetical protein